MSKPTAMYAVRGAISRSCVSMAWAKAGPAAELVEGCLDACEAYPAGGMWRGDEDSLYYWNDSYRVPSAEESVAWRSDL